MKIETKENQIILKEVYNSITLETREGKQLHICMRDMGFEVATKAEDEQALVIFTMLEFYKEYGKDWTDKMNEMLKAG